MKAYVCDRCKKMIGVTNDDTGAKYQLWTQGGGSRYDLCRECLADLDRWMNEKRKEDHFRDATKTIKEDGDVEH